MGPAEPAESSAPESRFPARCAVQLSVPPGVTQRVARRGVSRRAARRGVSRRVVPRFTRRSNALPR
eukprot:3425422-Lingulodinium_polyedra.AAC.1